MQKLKEYLSELDKCKQQQQKLSSFASSQGFFNKNTDGKVHNTAPIQIVSGNSEQNFNDSILLHAFVQFNADLNASNEDEIYNSGIIKKMNY